MLAPFVSKRWSIWIFGMFNWPYLHTDTLQKIREPLRSASWL